MFVVDASVALDWMLPVVPSAAADRAWHLAGRSLVVVPPLWLWETCNVTLRLLRQKRITPQDASDARLHLSLLNKRVDEIPNQMTINATWEIAEQQMLTFYDAVYLELCIRFQLPLASCDSALCGAAKRLGVGLI